MDHARFFKSQLRAESVGQGLFVEALHTSNSSKVNSPESNIVNKLGLRTRIIAVLERSTDIPPLHLWQLFPDGRL
jgi:hypothetical protein